MIDHVNMYVCECLLPEDFLDCNLQMNKLTRVTTNPCNFVRLLFLCNT